MAKNSVEASIFCRQNPTATISIGYFALSLIGLSFTWSLFREFDIDYFEFVDVTDFLMATLREPISLGLVVFAAFARWAVRWVSYKQYNWYHAKKRGRVTLWIHKSSGIEWSMRNPSVWWILFLLYCFIAINSFVEGKSKRIRAGEATHIQYLLADKADGSVFENAMLLGTSARFVFVYDHKTQISKVIPHESLLFMSFADKSNQTDVERTEPTSNEKQSTDNKLQQESPQAVDK